MVLLPVLAFLSVPPASTLRAVTYAYGPRGPVHVDRPEVVWVIQAENGKPPTRWKMTLNGKPVPAKFDASENSLEYMPRDAFSPGEYQVQTEVTFAHKYLFKKEWTFKVTDGPRASFAAANDDQQNALKEILAIRARLGLEVADMDDRLNAVSQAHSSYMRLNRRIGHLQSEGTPGFFGATAEERLGRFGWSRGFFEDVAMGHDTPEESVRELFDAPYHRIPFMQPGRLRVGTGFDAGFFAMVFGATNEHGVVFSPGHGETRVPLEWSAKETPDPRRIHGLPQRIGYPIVVAAFETWAQRLQVVSASLEANGQPVPTVVNDSSNDSHCRNAFMILPKTPLAPSTEYRVQVVAVTESRRRIERSWSFWTL